MNLGVITGCTSSVARLCTYCSHASFVTERERERERERESERERERREERGERASERARESARERDGYDINMASRALQGS
jgi:hypothetical protein